MGKIIVGFRECRDLPGVDSYGLASPYAVARVDGKKAKTRVVPNRNAPRWNETKELLCRDARSTLTVSVYHHKTLGKDVCLGSAEVPVETLTAQPTAEWHRLVGCTGGASPEILLELSAVGLDDTPPVPPEYQRSHAPKKPSDDLHTVIADKEETAFYPPAYQPHPPPPGMYPPGDAPPAAYPPGDAAQVAYPPGDVVPPHNYGQPALGAPVLAHPVDEQPHQGYHFADRQAYHYPGPGPAPAPLPAQSPGGASYPQLRPDHFRSGQEYQDYLLALRIAEEEEAHARTLHGLASQPGYRHEPQHRRASYHKPQGDAHHATGNDPYRADSAYNAGSCRQSDSCSPGRRGGGGKKKSKWTKAAKIFLAIGAALLCITMVCCIGGAM
mmetsp:Transcript_20481/g.51877  ORF Transcript_20481/g.51877 Transcript_20481/m.51877 type:complete len:384 (+) Transcript_20481:124-1275(+)|eukprot:CAMPEP_0177654080 /NCGR_PEP_ID=MMETSP0447-20121125/14108_1 /TAXON_ID=0 /ORGANISM="Stygamoeba regulata, Strain BSH-02190019" /LENGTH=383 /DNA_ID=CAMNT_0019157639 /DNA_START=107 /DNA_END=1258 /DNA_ORIENTATION=-